MRNFPNEFASSSYYLYHSSSSHRSLDTLGKEECHESIDVRMQSSMVENQQAVWILNKEERKMSWNHHIPEIDIDSELTD
jgi:hypothetical protein